MLRTAAERGSGERIFSFAAPSLWVWLALLAAFAAGGCSSRKGLEVNQEVGTVRLLSDPQGASIDFDGTPRGETFDAKPFVLRGVPQGWHTLRATLQNRVPHVVEFNLDRGEIELRVPLSIDGYGRLTVHTIPQGAEVFIDSRYYGKAAPQLQVNALTYGEHSLWVRLEGYRQERLNILVERQIERTYHLFLTKEK